MHEKYLTPSLLLVRLVKECPTAKVSVSKHLMHNASVHRITSQSVMVMSWNLCPNMSQHRLSPLINGNAIVARESRSLSHL